MPIRIQWEDQFLIKPERLELVESTKPPFKFLNFKSVVGSDFIPYKIQMRAWEEIISQNHCLLLISGTGSGKTPAVFLGIVELLLKNRKGHCLIMYPMKALAQDQEVHLREICAKYDLTVQRYDSSISQEIKAKIREKPSEILIITPDTLMASIIRTKNEDWFNHLTKPLMIWMDEFHATSGTLGTALCYLLRILYLGNPSLRFYFTSATLANAQEVASLFPHPTTIIEGGSRHGNIKFHVSIVNDFSKILELVLHDQGQFLVFIENKQVIEQLMETQDLFSRQVDRYHADLPDAERHLILSKFTKHELKGLLCTSAVSLGIDIQSVKNIVLYGFPRSFSLLFQQMGRGTRDPDSNGNVYLLLDKLKLIDNYYLSHLEELQKNIKSSRANPVIIDLLNEKILRGMVLFAIRIGLTARDKLGAIFHEANKREKLQQILTWLLIKGFISKNKAEYTCIKESANDFLFNFVLNLRPGFPKFEIVRQLNEEETLLGYIDAETIPQRSCKGNYYNKEGHCYLIKEINIDSQKILVEEVDGHYNSKNTVSTTVALMTELKFQQTFDLKVRLAECRVQIRPQALQNFKITDKNEEISEPPVNPNLNGEYFMLDFNTIGLLIELPSDKEFSISSLVLYQLSKMILRNAAVLINVSENEIDCYQEMSKKMLYFLDRSCPTGASQQLFENFESILKKTYQVLAACPCEEGCDKCSIPVESTYLMPNFQSSDRYRKKEMLEMLKRCLNESGSIK